MEVCEIGHTGGASGDLYYGLLETWLEVQGCWKGEICWDEESVPGCRAL